MVQPLLKTVSNFFKIKNGTYSPAELTFLVFIQRTEIKNLEETSASHVSCEFFTIAKTGGSKLGVNKEWWSKENINTHSEILHIQP